MKQFILVVWLMVPVAAGAYHFGPGQEQMKMDTVSSLLAQADSFVDAGQWEDAIRTYDQALARLPDEHTQLRRQVRLEMAKAKMHAGALPEAFVDLQTLNDELRAEVEVDPKLAEQVEEAFANAQFYVTWVLRLEGEPRENWEPIIESSRQTYRRLAEQATQRGDSLSAVKQKESLEAAIRLARLDLDELQGLPLPAQCKCKGNCSGCCKCKGNKGKQKGRKTGKHPRDFRGAGLGGEVSQGGS